ncbi:diacylglycerol/lipid kinase family protein [Glaciibacter psychrotolerans]|uniref:Diacylglycerol kinase family enzyme n=1 Tax=Glaciibacter psychrotolerans TaxID=670054 RepID=A0A7Z0EEJ5_9MICO|nr:diacylglycerol kinase family protein [Leifsonia psychrotolerans]NYJ19514.1 diacylglycerol kinase family enzyme [Leifsonia psychrotolerans]
MRATVIYNPVKVELDSLKAAAARAEKRHGWDESLWIATTEEDPGVAQAGEAIENSADVVIAAGGDGTVRAIGEGLHGSGIPLALLPSGTGNLLARNLDLSLRDLDDAVETAFSGVDRPIDVGIIDLRRPESSVDRRAFLVMAGLGIDAQMIENTDPALKKRAGWLAYVTSVVRSLRDGNELHVRYRLGDGATRRSTVHTFIVGNCGSLPANMVLMPDAQIDDGLLDIVMLRPEGALGWVRIWIRVAWENGILRRTRTGRRLLGRSKPIRPLVYEKCATLEASFGRPEKIELDGDAFGEVTAIRVSIDGGGLLVRMPRDETAN